MQDAVAHNPIKDHRSVTHWYQQNTHSGFVTVNLSDLADLVRRRVTRVRAPTSSDPVRG